MKSLLFGSLLGSIGVFGTFSGLAQQHKSAPRPASLVDKYFGFRDVRLETDLADHPEMKAVVGADSVASDPDKTYYARTRENLQIGDTKAAFIQYFYYKGRAEGVLVVVTSAADRLKLLAALRAKYGEPVQSPAAAKTKAPEAETFSWPGTKATLTLNKLAANGEASMLLLSKALWQREQADKKRKAAAGL